jgi:hypothetical protein
VENLEVLSTLSPGDRPQMTNTKSFNQNDAYPEDKKKRVGGLRVECKGKRRITGDVKVWTGMTIFSH